MPSFSPSDELARQQRDVAEMHDDLNVADKKMKAIKSGWGNLANITSSKVRPGGLD